MPGDVLAAAVGYTARGWFVVPCCWPDADGACACGRRGRDGQPLPHAGNSAAKAALFAGYQEARADADQVRTWWRRWPQANVGLLLEPSGLLAIDLDGPEAAAEAKERGLPPAPAVRSGSGWHVYFRRPAGVAPGRLTHGGACERIDVLGTGLLTAPPSLHRTGRRYAWAADRRDLPLPEPPAWAVEMLRPKAAPQPPMLQTAALPARPERLSARIEAVLRDGHAGHYASRSEAVAAVVFAMIGAGYPPAHIAAELAARPWAGAGKPDPQGYFAGEIARALAAGAAPHVLEPAPAAEAAAAFGRLPRHVQGLFAGSDKARHRGAVKAARAGLTPEQVATVLLACNGGDLDEARGVARWAARRAAEGTAQGGGRHAG